jgi:hypothetical protein
MPLRKSVGKSKPARPAPKQVKKTPGKKRVEESEDEYDNDDMDENFVGFNRKDDDDEQDDDEQEVFKLNLGKDYSDEVRFGFQRIVVTKKRNEKKMSSLHDICDCILCQSILTILTSCHKFCNLILLFHY